MKLAPALFLIPCFFASSSLKAADVEKHVFQYRETDDESVEWQIELEFNNGSVNGKITEYLLKPLDYPTNKVWSIDKSTAPSVCGLTGKLTAGATKQKKKLEVRETTTGKEPMWIQFNKGQASWTLVTKSDSLYELQVPAKHYMGMHEYKKVLTFKEQDGAPLSESKSESASKKDDNARRLIGIWLVEKQSEDATEVVMKFKSDFSFSFEVEESAFDTGSWKIVGDNITLTRAKEKPVTFPIKFISDKVLLWSNKKGKGSKLTRLE